MFRTATAAFLTVGLLAAIAQATVIEIPLPGLLGPYPLDESHGTRTVTVVLPQIPTVIHGASFRVSGTTVVGSITCEWGPEPWHIDIHASMDAGNAHYWSTFDYAYIPQVSGPFAWTADFRAVPVSGTTWEFFMDGEAQVQLNGFPADLVGLCFLNPSPPSAVVEEAVLIIDAEFPVSIEPSTWGAIKALYR